MKDTMSKKKFNETKVGAFLSKVAPSILDVAGDILPDAGVFSLVKGLIKKDTNLPVEDKEKALMLLEQDMTEMQEVTKRWVADSQGSKLTQNVRPLTLIFLTIAFVIGWFLQIDELEVVKELLTITFLAYFGGRSVEKIKNR